MYPGNEAPDMWGETHISFFLQKIKKQSRENYSELNLISFYSRCFGIFLILLSIFRFLEVI